MGEKENSRAGLKKALEALIFVSPEGISVKRLAEILECPPGDVQKAAAELAEEYRARESGLAVLGVAGGYQLATAPELAPLMEKHLTVIRKRHLSQPAMETLAIVAYRQPVTKPEIEAIRGVDSSGVLGGLLEKKLIRLAGRKKAPGRPLMFATTREFLVHFGLKDLRELPALSELGRPPGQEAEVELAKEAEAGETVREGAGEDGALRPESPPEEGGPG